MDEDDDDVDIVEEREKCGEEEFLDEGREYAAIAFELARR